ncbi:MAG: membrane dipeptidase, partial [Pyrinomonadaceae bacterium]|nr:membrane dipeptidase [Pyrinomonadaceae bacterium]
MTRISLLALMLSISVVSDNCRMLEKNQNNAPSAPRAMDAVSVTRRAIAIDMHADTTQRMLDEGVDINNRLADGHFDAVRMKEGGLSAQFFSIWVAPDLYGSGGASAIRRADEQIKAVRALAEKHPETWELARSAADIRRISAEGKLAALMGLEGAYAIDERI